MSKSKSTLTPIDPFDNAEKRAYTDILSVAKGEHAEGYLAAQYLNLLRQKDTDYASPFFNQGRAIYNHYLANIAKLRKEFKIKAHSLTPIPSWD